jgi:hypothetical protein
MQDDVAATLTRNDKAEPLQSGDDLAPGKVSRESWHLTRSV